MMSYRVVYHGGTAHRKQLTGAHSYRGVLAIGFLVLFLGAVVRFSPEGRAVLTALLFPGDGSAARAAETMAESLLDGMPVGQAVECFFREVLGALY